MVEIVQPKEMKAYDYETGKLKKCKPKDVYDIELVSTQELVNLAETLGVTIIFQMGKEFIFRNKGINFYAKQ